MRHYLFDKVLVLDYRNWKFSALWVVVSGIILARIPIFWSTGEFVAEDGWVYFAEAFNNTWINSLLTPYSGYFHLVPRILAEVFSPLPVAAQPFIYAFTGIGLNALILSVFYLPNFRILMPLDAARVSVCIVLALAQNSENLGTLLGQHWYLTFLLLLLLVMEFPKSKLGRYSTYTASVLSVWSSPSNLVLLPFLFWSWWRNKESPKGKWILFTSINLIVVAVFMILLRMREADFTAEFSAGHIPVALDRLVLRGWFGTGILGQTLTEALVALQPWLLDLFAIIAIGGVITIIAKLKSPKPIRIAVLWLGSACLMIGLSLTRSLYLTELSQLDLPIHERYLTTPTLLLNAFVMLLCYELLSEKKIAWFFGIWGIQCALLISGIPNLNHWAKPAINFHISDYAQAVESFNTDYLKAGKNGELYIPSDIPYAGPVLRSGTGMAYEPGEILEDSLKKFSAHNEKFRQGMNQFLQIPGSTQIRHPALGTLDYNGVAEGRFWFRDSDNKLLFTSELLYPNFWSMDGLSFSLIKLEKPIQ